MSIRKLNEKDIEACSKLYIETFNCAPWNDRWDDYSAYRRLHDIYISPGFFGMVYEENSEIIAAALGNKEQWFEGYMFNLREMFVKSNRKGNGIGSKMLASLEKALHEEDTSSVVLFTTKGDLTEKFYLNNEYVVDIDMVMMSKRLCINKEELDNDKARTYIDRR